jgi:preprotein translocase subunit SecB
MADETPVNGNGADDQLPQVAVLTQYVKDLSFENPNAPASLQAGAEQPQIDINVGVNARRANDTMFEVELKISATAKAGDSTSFVVDLLYAALFGLQNVPDDALEPFLLIEAPRILFPFARRIIADAVRDGGFPPLMLDPIDFHSLYMAQRGLGPDGQPIGNA